MKDGMVWAQEAVVSVLMGVLVLAAASVLAAVGMMMTAAFVISGGPSRAAALRA